MVPRQNFPGESFICPESSKQMNLCLISGWNFSSLIGLPSAGPSPVTSSTLGEFWVAVFQRVTLVANVTERQHGSTGRRKPGFMAFHALQRI